ncbi:hypothetical protein [Acidiluteibacter ferrifornacis]|uniref:Uncharacterized protein n=1 Tax=Acidiluteibacter ferrifornacis TaxID=2692424 RepID=A0A6N9NL27_9FLAO|nr:hypothetical protein [Acidiluteibacter ferrifornacis]NBG67406.1 hypothetical protein [Acidiluteibacter ferrifornacis]
MTFKKYDNLIVKGTSIEVDHILKCSESEFKTKTQSLLISEDDLNPFSLSKARFIGNFHGFYGREFSIKPKSSFLRTKSISNSIWINGKIEPFDENQISISILYNRTDFLKLGQKVLKYSLGILLLIISIKTLINAEILNFIIFGSAILFFYLIAILIFIGHCKDQISYFENHLIKTFDK